MISQKSPTMILSRKAKESIKTALAMSIAYAVALRMGWDKPMWAGFAVAFVSLATVGQSLNKAALRMLGTLVGAGVALTLIALFSQERWLFILFLSIWLGFCTYWMGGKKHQYFWHVCGFVCVIICMDGGPNSADAFNIAVLRTQETGLGILVYGLIALLLWPTNSGNDFKDAANRLAAAQQQLFRALLGAMNGQDNAEQAQALRAQEHAQYTRVSQLLDSAEIDSPQVRQFRQQWRQYQVLTGQLAETMECWRESFAEAQKLDLSRLLPDLKGFTDELDQRLTQVGTMLAGQAPQQAPTAVEWVLDETEVRKLPHFQKAALAVMQSHFQKLEQLTRSLFETVSQIKGGGQEKAAIQASDAPVVRWALDLDRLASSVRVMATVWIAFLTLIYVNDIPGGSAIVTMAASLGMAMATMPQLSVTVLFAPAAVGVLFASVLYIFIMPQLSSFWGLGTLIFAATFTICYLFAEPRKVLGRALGLAMFVSIASISNQQSYSFLVVANTAMMFPVLFFILAVTAYIPFSPRPEVAFLRLLRRFFTSCQYLMSTMDKASQKSETYLSRQRKAFHTHEILTVPQKLGAWARCIDTKFLSDTSPQQIQAMVSGLQSLSFRVQALDKERDKPQAPFLVKELFEDVHAWCLKSKETFEHLSVDPTSGEQAVFQKKLAQVTEQMDKRIKETLDQSDKRGLSSQDGENFYRLLGAYRGLSEAMVEYAGASGGIDWAGWRQEKF
ncbi:MAG: FUSC family protein [Planctomycetota bacterium]